MSASLFDPKASFFRECFQSATSYHEFLKASEPAHGARWQAVYEMVPLSAAQRELLASFKRKMHVLVLAGSWCGDCARQCPIVQKIAEATTSIELRFIDNQQIPQLRDELRIHGAARVPVVLSLSEDFFEINRFGDRPLAVYQRKARTELGAACDIGHASTGNNELEQETAEWLANFERLELMLRVSPFLRTRHKD